MTKVPEFLWSQTSDKIHVVILVRNSVLDNESIHISGSKLEINIKDTKGVHYSDTLDLYDEVDDSYKVDPIRTDPRVVLNIPKKNKETEFWPRLVKEKIRSNIRLDFSTIVDEDDEKEDDKGFDGLNDFGGINEDYLKFLQEKGGAGDYEGELDEEEDKEDEGKGEEEKRTKDL